MKSLKLYLSLIVVLSTFSLHAQDAKTETVKVWGNCGMCKSTIEKAAKSAGATTASWDMESNILSVSFAAGKTSLKAIEQKVASAGYDTRNVSASEEAYQGLHGCCKYERKASDNNTAACCKDNAKCTGDKCCDASAAKAGCCKPAEGSAACCTSGKSCCAKA